MEPTSKDKLTISSQYGIKMSKLSFNSDAGIRSTGEHLIPKDMTICLISSSVAGSNSDRGIIPSGRSTCCILEFIDGVIDALILLTLLLKNLLNLLASSTSEDKEGNTVSSLLSSNWLTTYCTIL